MRMEQYLRDMDFSKRILEIGPLATPILSKDEADVYYADILPTQEIRELYKKDPSVKQESICEIDFVIRDSYTESCKDVEKFDYIISSHVLEHIPRLIEFFNDTAHILHEGGKMYIALPDCRYCFDHFRSPTSFAEMYYIHAQGLAFAPWQVLNHISMAVPFNDAAEFWTNRRLFSLLAKRRPFAEVKARFEKSLQGEYIPVHFSTFTPESFLLLLHEMTRAGVFPYKLAHFFPTLVGSFTFGAVLEACPELPDSERASAQEMSGLRRRMVQLVDYEEGVQTALKDYMAGLANPG